MAWDSVNTGFRVRHRAHGLTTGSKRPTMWALYLVVTLKEALGIKFNQYSPKDLRIFAYLHICTFSLSRKEENE
jgi:hypothetical protein